MARTKQTKREAAANSNNGKRKAAEKSASTSRPTKKTKAPKKEEEPSNAAFWKKKFRLADGTESTKTPYQHLWEFLEKNDGQYLVVVKRWPYKGRKQALHTKDVAREAREYLLAREIDKDEDSIRSQFYKMDSDILSAMEMQDISGAGDEENTTLKGMANYSLFFIIKW